MPANTFGRIFSLTTFGESHGPAIGGIVEGCPAGLNLNIAAIQQELDRRKPGQSSITTQRNEHDQIEMLSGVFDGVTTGAPIGFVIRNKDQKSADYDHLKENYRPSHADFTTEKKYGIRDHRGGGRSSARETACRVAGGAIARQFLNHSGISVNAFVKQIGPVICQEPFEELDLEKTYESIVRCPHNTTAVAMEEYINHVKKEGDTVGGIVQCIVQGQPAGLGEPVFDKLHAVMGHAMLSINAVKGFEIGSGFKSAYLRGSEHNDIYYKNEKNAVKTRTNHAGGVQGGISNGMPLVFNVAFKPVSTIMQSQQSINKHGETVQLEGKGRHDPCVLPRAVPVVEAMATLVMADFLLLQRCSTL